jgi:hypothetical protein
MRKLGYSVNTLNTSTLKVVYQLLVSTTHNSLC